VQGAVTDGVILITGASRGIGAATARLAGQRGYSVCVNYRSNRAAAETVVAAIERDGAKAVAADVAVEGDVVRLFETCDKTLGSLTALVNNAGILKTRRAAGAPNEVARAILWLLSAEASYTTGSFIDVTGGK
jgi:NAD(P)-dependent dehydrogenase (short-subunit alcohol dehydrogenase family)